MKRPIAVFFSLILILALISTAPAVAFADNSFATDEADKKEPLTATELLGDARAIKIPGPSAVVLGSAKASVENVTATSFHNDSLPDSGWIAIDNDGDGYSWEYGKNISPNFYSLEGRDGECMVSASFVNNVGVVTPDNWLVSPGIKIPEGKQLNLYVCGQDPNYYAEHFAVYVSTSSQTDISSFTNLYEATVTKGGGSYEGVAVDLTVYAGQTVYLAIRHFNCTDQYYLNLDGLSIVDVGTDPTPPIPDPTIIRIMGNDRYSTSIQVALELLSTLDESKYPNVMIATGDSFPDALAGSALSTAADAPILLISSRVPSTVDNAIAFISDYVDPNGKVYILGGTGVVPETVERRVKDLGYQGDSIIRFAGQDRYETNLKVLALLRQMNDGQMDSLLICDGTNWPDAATASATGLPILLVPKAGLNDAQKSLLATLNQPIIYVIGGPGAVSDSLFNSLKVYDPGAVRLAGANRAETAVKVARTYFDLSKVKAVTFAYGANFPDTIAGGLLAHLLDAPILYGDSKVPTPYINADAPYVMDCGAKTAYVLGGEALVGDDFIIDLLAPNML